MNPLEERLPGLLTILYRTLAVLLSHWLTGRITDEEFVRGASFAVAAGRARAAAVGADLVRRELEEHTGEPEPLPPVFVDRNDGVDRLEKAVTTIVDDRLAPARPAPARPVPVPEPDEDDEPDDEPPRDGLADVLARLADDGKKPVTSNADGLSMITIEPGEVSDEEVEAAAAAIERMERLARSETSEAAQRAAQDAMRGDGRFEGWRRELNGDACQLCTWWWRNGRVWPKTYSMPRHPGCDCWPRPVMATYEPKVGEKGWERSRRDEKKGSAV